MPNLKLATIYAHIPPSNCQGKCQASCGPVPMSTAEWAEIRKRTSGRTPKVRTKGNIALLNVGDDLTCPLLDRELGRCTVYEVRPLLCRLYGSVAGMRCEHGCTPDRVMPDAEAHALIDEAMKLGA